MDQSIHDYYNAYQIDRFLGQRYIEQLRLYRFAQGELLYELDQPIEQIFFLVEGRVKVVLPVENARQLLLCFYKPLQLFGELELFEAEPLATTTIEAVNDCVCLGLQRSFVVMHLINDPLFLQQISRSLGKKLDRVIRNSALNLLHPLEHRLASYISATAVVDNNQQLVFSGNLTQIAELLGTSFRHLHRTLQRFCQEGLLAKRNASYIVLQPAQLEQRAAGVYVVP